MKRDVNIEGILFVEYVCVNKIDPIDEGKNNHGAGILEELIFFHSNRRKDRIIKSRYSYNSICDDAVGLYKISLDWLYFLGERGRFSEHDNERKHQGVLSEEKI